MPKKGKKKKNSKNSNCPSEVRAILGKEDGQEYAEVLKMLGDRRVNLKCYDGVERQGKIRGAMRNRVWVGTGNIVLIALRDFTEKCVDVIHVYNDDEVHRLRKMGALIDLHRGDPQGVVQDETSEQLALEDVFDFETV